MKLASRAWRWRERASGGPWRPRRYGRAMHRALRKLARRGRA